MATTPIDPAVQAQLDSLRSDLAKARAQIASGNSNSKSAIANTADIISNKSMADKLTSALNLLPDKLLNAPGMQEAMGVVKDAATLVGAITDKAIEEANAVFSMYRSGVAISMDQLTSTANAFGVSIDGLTKLMTKHARVVSIMGIDATTQLGMAFLKMTNRGASLGMTQDQANDALLDYVDMINRTGRLQQINVDALASSARKFSIALNEASQASGLSVDQIRQDTAARLAQGDAIYATASMSAEEYARYTDVQVGLNYQNTELANKLKDASVQLIAGKGSLGAIKDPAILSALSAASQYDPNVRAKFVTALTTATGEEQQRLLREVGEAFQKVAQANPTAAVGEFGPSAAFMGQVMGQVLQLSPGAPQAVDPNAEKIEAIVSNVDAAVNTFNNAINDLSTGAFKTFSDDILAASGKIVSFADKLGDIARNIEQNPPSRETLGLAAGGLLAADIIATAMSSFLATTPTSPGSMPDGTGGGSVPPIPTAGGSGSSMSTTTLAAIGAALVASTAAITAYITSQSGTTPTTSNTAISPTIPLTTTPVAPLTPIGPIPGSPETINQNPNAPTATSNDDRQLTRDAIDTIVEQSSADRNMMMQQDVAMNTKLELMLQQLSLLNTNITDQTTALRNAFDRGSNNVYP